MKLGNPLFRVLATLVVIAVAIRAIYELLLPALPFLLLGFVLFLVFRLLRWHRERW